MGKVGPINETSTNESSHAGDPNSGGTRKRTLANHCCQQKKIIALGRISLNSKFDTLGLGDP